MLDRNRRIKPKPERFQDVVEEFDVIFTVEERIYDAAIEGVLMSYDFMVHILCLRFKNNLYTN